MPDAQIDLSYLHASDPVSDSSLDRPPTSASVVKTKEFASKLKIGLAYARLKWTLSSRQISGSDKVEAPFCLREVECRRRSVRERLVWSFVVVEVEVLSDARSRLAPRVVTSTR